MALQVFEFISVLVHATHLWVSLLAAATGINPGYKLYRDGTFTSQQMNFLNEKVCSTQNPDLVSHRARSKTECAVLCKGTEGCTGVNWKKPSTCELYVTSQTSFGADASCTYFGLGKKFKLETFCLHCNYLFCRVKLFDLFSKSYQLNTGRLTFVYMIL